MAWRPNDYVIDGELDNTVPNMITGFINFAGIGRITLNLKGNFHRDIRGAKIQFIGNGNNADPKQAKKYLQDFARVQTGNAGDITAGRVPADYVKYPYIEWYGTHNGRVVIELDAEQVEVVGTPIPACESDPIDRKEQGKLLMGFVMDLAGAIKKSNKKGK